MMFEESYRSADEILGVGITHLSTTRMVKRTESAHMAMSTAITERSVMIFLNTDASVHEFAGSVKGWR
ncbi:hypothetical protein N185_15860 [Sinorhizobium sp. GW3]|nr:hypothetical protein N185_15860 [Sinorhizobium sp. GW3]